MVNPYESPKSPETAALQSLNRRLWLWAACSILASVFSLFLFNLYGHWHWHQGPWEQTLPGQMGLSWIVTVGSLKEWSTWLAAVSAVITIVVFLMGGRRQGMATLPTCLLSLLSIPVVT